MKYEAPVCEMMNVNSEDIIRTSTGDTSLTPLSPSKIKDSLNQNQEI